MNTETINTIKQFSEKELVEISNLTRIMFSKFGKPFYSYYEKDGADRSNYLVDYSQNDYYREIESKLIDLIFGKIYSVGTASCVKYVENVPSINNRTFSKYRTYNTVKGEYTEYNSFNNLVDLFSNPNYCDFHDEIILEDFPNRKIFVRQSTLNPDVFIIYNGTTHEEMIQGKQYESWYHLFYFEGLSKYEKLKDKKVPTEENGVEKLTTPEDKILVDKEYYNLLVQFHSQNCISGYTQKQLNDYRQKLKELDEIEDYLLPTLAQYSKTLIKNTFSEYDKNEKVKLFRQRILNKIDEQVWSQS